MLIVKRNHVLIERYRDFARTNFTLGTFYVQEKCLTYY